MTQATAHHTNTIKLINSCIDDYFVDATAHARDIDSAYADLWQRLHGLIQAGGKRLRPQMTLLAYEAFGGTVTPDIIRVAASQELLHFSLLIHDDVIDRDLVRHGVPNIIGQYDSVYQPQVSDDDDRIHYAYGTAIIGGDLMLSGAYQLVLHTHLSDGDKLLVQELLGRSIFDVAGGQLLDIEVVFGDHTKEKALKVARHKTAGYSFLIPLLTGAKLAGASKEECDLLSKYAVALGIAFQLVDDLLGVFGIEEDTGKSASSDIVEGKHTYMIEQAKQSMANDQKEVFDKYFGNSKADASSIEAIKQILIESGAQKRTKEAIGLYTEQARQALEQLQLPTSEHNKLEELISKATERRF